MGLSHFKAYANHSMNPVLFVQVVRDLLNNNGFLSSAIRAAGSQIAGICTAIAARTIQIGPRMRGLDVPHGVAAWSACVYVPLTPGSSSTNHALPDSI